MWFQDYNFNDPTSSQSAFDQSQENAHIVYPLEESSDAMKNLHGFSPVAIIDLGLTESDRQALDQLEMTNITSEDGYGNCLPEFPCPAHSIDLPTHSVYDFLNTIAPKSPPETINHVGDIILNITNKVADSLSGLKNYNGGFVIHTFTPMDDQVGWHTDDFCSHNNNDKYGPMFMFLATLKGDHTLYYTGSYDYEVNKCLPAHNEHVPSEFLIDSKLAYSPSLGFASVHIGHETNGAIHSWPNITKPRLLLKISLTSDSCN